MKKLLAILLSAVFSLSVAIVPVSAQTAIVNEKPVYSNHVIAKATTYVYITKTGEKYHSAGCRYLKKSCYKITLKKAKSDGYTPCSRCNPPSR